MAGIGQEQQQSAAESSHIQSSGVSLVTERKKENRTAHRGPLVQEADLVSNPLSAVASPRTAESGLSAPAIFE